MIRYTTYHRAQSLEEAYALMQKKRNMVLGGMIWLNLGKGKYNTVIDLCDLNLEGIKETAEEFVIGAYTSLHTLETDARLNGFFSGAFRDCLGDIEGIQLRNMATVGGTVALRAGFSDLCTLLLALDAKVELFKAGVVSIEEYIRTDRRQKDILVNVIVPKTTGCCMYTAVRNSKTDLPVLNCSAAKKGDAYRLVLGARPGIGQLVQFNANEIPHAEEERKAFAKAIADRYVFGTNLRGSAEYRKMLAEAFVIRAIAALEGGK